MTQGAFNKLSEILTGNNRIVIPDLQRDFCWGTTKPEGKKENLVYSFVKEMILEAEKRLNYSEFSYGIVYTYEYPKTFLYLCDGQQRLTTLYLIMGALYCHSGDEKLLRILRLPDGQPRLKYEIRNTTDYFIRDLLNNVFLKREIRELSEISKTTWFRGEYTNDPSVENIVTALHDICKLIDKNNYAAICDFLLNKVGFVYIELEATDNVSKPTFSKIREYGEKMYEIVNTCGDPMVDIPRKVTPLFLAKLTHHS